MEEPGQGEKWEEAWEHHRPLAPMVTTIVAVIGWLVFILLFALYWSNGFTIFQDVIVTIVSLVIMGLLIGLVWVVWGMRYARFWGMWSGQGKPKSPPKPFGTDFAQR